MNDWGQQQQQTNGGCVAALPDNPKRQREGLGSKRGQITPCFLFSFEQGSIIRFEGCKGSNYLCHLSFTYSAGLS